MENSNGKRNDVGDGNPGGGRSRGSTAPDRSAIDAERRAVARRGTVAAPFHPDRGSTKARGRGAVSNPVPRFQSWSREADPHCRQDDIGQTWDAAGDEADDASGSREARTAVETCLEKPMIRLQTTVTTETARTIIARNTSPDIPFDRSLNAYRGCEHGCVYCFARPTHAYLDLSPGIDFETKLFVKTNAVEKLREAFDKPGYRADVLALGANTDPYQPIEKTYRITRDVLALAEAYRHPIAITTKSALVVRDIDILERMAAMGLVRVFMSIGTLDAEIARKLEPRASTPPRRIEAIRQLQARGIPCGVVVAPVIPALTDFDVEHVLQEAARAGAQHAGYVMLRLPLEVRDLFVAWLDTHYPDRRRHVLSLIEQMRGGRHYDATFGQRMRGTGLFAELLAQRFTMACRRYGLNASRPPLRTDLFASSPARLDALARRDKRTQTGSTANGASGKDTAPPSTSTAAPRVNPQLDLFSAPLTAQSTAER
ncbi:PA0069 family radical SAM protein [Robbsia sp. KACC 23696]|uniref:PA0069 family radical SAM protein n=1 Tax=Robbsia sp. KACC 23696 TaxID=3149231 RepID=UPI00325AD5D5